MKIRLKHPTICDAIQLKKDNLKEVLLFLGAKKPNRGIHTYTLSTRQELDIGVNGKITIFTPIEHYYYSKSIEITDWILKDKGNFFIVDPKDFEETWEEIT